MLQQAKALGLQLNREGIFQALSNLRKGLLHIGIVVILSGVIVFPVSKELLAYICRRTLDTNLVAYSIPEAFFSLLKLTL